MDSARLLVVKDQGVSAMDLTNRLTSLGYTIAAVVSSGEMAIQQAAQLHPDLVLMDIVLEGPMDGLEAAARIHEQVGVPIVYLAAHSNEQGLERARATEPYGYILKTFADQDLRMTIEMALHRRQLENRLKQTERWLAATLRSIGDAVIITDVRGCITYMNPVAEALTGWRQADAVRQDVTKVMNLVDAEKQEPVVNPILRALREGQAVGLPPNTVLDHQGRYISVEDSAAPIWDETGHLTGGVLVFKDVTERKRAESELRRMNLELQVRNAELDAFAHTVAHDLKNPINMIMGYAELLVQDDVGLPVGQRQKSLDTIGRTARKLNNIVEEMLLLAGVRNMDAPLTQLDMAQVVAEAQQRVMDLITQYGAEIILPSSWPAAFGYAPWVEEIWANYLSNAIKYGGRPPRAELGGAARADGMARFWVSDNGAGLRPEQQAQLFKPFTQLAQAHASGYGLGLSIVQRIAEKLGGEVGVESSGMPGQGCTFSFTLPATRPAPGQDELDP